MKNVTRWSPDTCGCVIDYEYDSVTGDVTHKATIHACPAHSGDSGKAKHLTTLLDENRRKNKTLGDAAEIAGVDLSPNEEKVVAKLAARVFNTEEDRIVFERVLLDGLNAKAQDFIDNYKYHFDTDRNLVIEHQKLSVYQKQALRDKTDAFHGKNKVKVV